MIGYQCFVRGLEPGSDDGAGSTEHQCGRQPSAVGDTACRQHRDRTCDIDDSRYERQRGAPAAVTARLGALRRDDVRAHLERATGLRQGSHLNDERDPRGVDRVYERGGIAERQHDRRRRLFYRRGDHGRADLPGQEADAPRLAGSRPGAVAFPVEPPQIAAPGADYAQPTALGNSCRQGAACDIAHRSQNHGMVDGEHLGQRCAQPHAQNSRNPTVSAVAHPGEYG